jgi:hypothetical protein
MRTTATRNAHDTTTERALFMAFELREKNWQLGFTTGHGQQPRERAVAARHQARMLQEIAQAKRRFGLPDTAPVVSYYDTGRPGTGAHQVGDSARTRDDHGVGLELGAGARQVLMALWRF